MMRREDGDEDEDEFDMDGENMSEKDETELELERLIFGDSAAFREGLRGSALATRGDDEDEEQTNGLDGLDDADVGQALEPRSLLGTVC